MNAFKKLVSPGTVPGEGKLWVEIDWDGKRLSISGETNHRGGQIDLTANKIEYALGWNAAMIQRLREIWRRWHLNDMRAGIAEQCRAIDEWREAGSPFPEKYSRVLQVRDRAIIGKSGGSIKSAIRLMVASGEENFSQSELDNLPKLLDLMGSDYILACLHLLSIGLYEVPTGKELATAWGNFVPEMYIYGSAWVYEDVPEDVLEFLKSLPEIEAHGKSPGEMMAEEFLEKHGIEFKATFKGDKCPPWDDDKHIHGDRYVITLKRKNKSFSFDFWNSFNDAREGKKPTAYGVLAVIEKNDPGAFEDFCSEFGYDTDSRKAEKTYGLVVEQWEEVEGFFTEEELEELREIN